MHVGRFAALHVWPAVHPPPLSTLACGTHACDTHAFGCSNPLPGSLVLPIRGALSPPSSFLLVYTIGITLVALIYYAFSYFVALDLNDNVTSGSITAYLTQDMDSLHSPAWLVHATNITLTLMVVITYPLMFFPVIEIINDESTRGQATATR